MTISASLRRLFATGETPTMPNESQLLVERFYYNGWNKADEFVMAEVLDENVKYRGALGRKPRKGIASFLDYMNAAHNALGSNKCKIEELVVSENGQKVAARVMNRGIHKNEFFGVAATGFEVAWSSAAFFKIANNKIVECFVVGDVDSLKQQIGAAADTSDSSSTGSFF